MTIRPDPRPTRTARDDAREVLDRVRRMETRLTRFLETQGFDTGVQRARWENGTIVIPTPLVALSECLAAIPVGWTEAVPIEHKGVTLGWWEAA